eukprot:jgi/Chlat1/4002/Chrsp26S04071
MAWRVGRGLAAVAGGLVFGNPDEDGWSSAGGQSNEDEAGVEALLERIANGTLPSDRRSAVMTLRDETVDSTTAQLAVGAMGFPVLTGVLRDERQDTEMIRAALEVLLNAMGITGAPPPADGKGIRPAAVNAELFVNSKGSVSLLLSLLEEEDFYVRYHAVQLLTLLLQHSSGRLQEVILQSPMGVSRLMDMTLEREVIRNEALLLLVALTRSNDEIQKIVVFESAFDRVFSIISEEGYAEGGIIVQDCLELLNNLLRGNISNQVYFRECGFMQQVPPLIRQRASSLETLSRQKATNILCALETVALLLSRGSGQPEMVANCLANQTLLGQSKIIEALLPLALEGRVSLVPIRAQALFCLSMLVEGHAGNCDILAIAEVEDRATATSMPALSAALRSALVAADPVERRAALALFAAFCKGNRDGQEVLVSTITPLPQADAHSLRSLGPEASNYASFGSALIKALLVEDGQGDLQVSCRAAAVLAHVLKNNTRCKQKIPLEIPASPASPPDLLMPRIVQYLSTANRTESTGWQLQPVLLRLLATWLYDCPAAVSAFLSTPSHLPFLADIASRGTTIHAMGLAAVVLGLCLVYNADDTAAHASTVLDVINIRIGLPQYFQRWTDMRRSDLFLQAAAAPKLPKAMTRATAAQAFSEPGKDSSKADSWDVPIYDAEFVMFVELCEEAVKSKTISLYARPDQRQPQETQSQSPVVIDDTADLQHQLSQYRELVQRLQADIRDLQARNARLTESAVQVGRADALDSSASSAEVVELRARLQAAEAAMQTAINDAASLQTALHEAQATIAKYEADLQGLSGAYNTLEQENYRLEELMQMRQGETAPAAAATAAVPSEEALAAAREEGREAAAAEFETEMNDLLVCLGQEETKTERLRNRLEALGVDVDALLATAVEQSGAQGEEGG